MLDNKSLANFSAAYNKLQSAVTHAYSSSRNQTFIKLQHVKYTALKHQIQHLKQQSRQHNQEMLYSLHTRQC